MTKLVHVLVLEAFHGPRPRGHEGAHLDGDRTNNVLSNLTWTTHRENEAHKIAHGTRPIGERNVASKLVGWQVAEIRYLHERGVKQARLAELFEISKGIVHEIATGQRWPHIEARQDVPAMRDAILTLTAEVRRLRVGLGTALEGWEHSDDTWFLREGYHIRKRLRVLLPPKGDGER